MMESDNLLSCVPKTGKALKEIMDHPNSVSIITVVLNAPDALEQTILSVTGQTYTNKEFIVIDGGSTDNTKMILEKYRDQLSISVSEPDLGPYDAMNKGLVKASGEWVIFMNAGDMFPGSHVLTKIFSRDLTDVGIIYGDCIADYHEFRIFRKAGAINDLWKGMIFSHQSVAVRTFLVKERGFQTAYSIGADYDLFCRLSSEGKRFLYLNETFAKFEAFGISHRKMLASVTQHYKIIRKYKKLSFTENVFYVTKLFSVAFITLIYKTFPKRYILRLIKLLNKKNLESQPSFSTNLRSADRPGFSGSPINRIVNYGRSKMDLFRTFRLKLIVAKVLHMIRLINGTLRSIQEPPAFVQSTDPKARMKIGMIDNSYHSKTISSFFFIEFLKDQCSFEIFWDTQWNGGKLPDLQELNNRKYDLVLIWQVFIYYKPEYLRKLNCRKVIIIPMFDDAHAIPDHFFLRYREFPFISFSRQFQYRFEQLGIRSACFQFFIDPAKLPDPKDDFSELKGFFWQRNNDITWEHIRQLIAGKKFSKFHLHLAIDPLWYKEVLPSKEDIMQYNISISRWFDKKEDYLSVLSQANVFFAPRLFEGIGMPVIEAMTMGKLVVAPDHPTMNEYITHGKNGLLYDIHDLKPLDFTHAGTMAARGREDCFTGFGKWQKTKMELLNFISVYNQM